MSYLVILSDSKPKAAFCPSDKGQKENNHEMVDIAKN